MSLRVEIVDETRALRHPLVTSKGEVTVREGFVLQVWQDDQRIAQGECAPLPGFSVDTLAECRIHAALWSPTEGALSSPDFWVERGAQVAHLPALRCATDTVAIALAESLQIDLKGWPARKRSRVRANALAHDVDSAKARVDEGFSVLKIKVGADSLFEDVQRVKAIRAAVGDRITLRLDANRAWPTIEAHNAIEVFAPSRISLLEEPLANGGARELAELRAQSIIPIGADEQARDEASIRTLIDCAAMDTLVLKPMLVGGPLQCIALAALAHQRGTESIVTTTIDGPVATRMAIEVAARLPSDRAHGLATAILFENDDAFPPIVRGSFNLGRTS